MDVVLPDDWSQALVIIDVQNRFYRVTKGLRASFDRCFGQSNINRYGQGNDCPDIDAIAELIDFRLDDKAARKPSMDCFHDSEPSTELTDSGCDSIVLSGWSPIRVSFQPISPHTWFNPYAARRTLVATDQENVAHAEAIAATSDEATISDKPSRFLYNGQFDYKCRLRWGWHECVRCLQIGHRDRYVQRSPLQG